MAVTGWTYSGPEVVQTSGGDIHKAKLLYLTTPMMIPLKFTPKWDSA